MLRSHTYGQYITLKRFLGLEVRFVAEEKADCLEGSAHVVLSCQLQESQRDEALQCTQEAQRSNCEAQGGTR